MKSPFYIFFENLEELAIATKFFANKGNFPSFLKF